MGKNSLQRIFVFMSCVVSSLFVWADETVDYRPAIHGALRTRWEMDLENDASRFQVRNARVTLDGKVAPSIDYFIQTDLCDRGTMKILDAWGRIAITDHLKFQAGQFRMPFGVEPFRAPSNYIFANRSFIGKQVCNVRAVGAKIMYNFAKLPLDVEFGAFNPTSISDHEKWCKTLAYAAKVSYKINKVKLTTGVQSISPDSVRINLIDGSVSWSSGRWLVEGEYMYKHYTHSTHKACNAYCVYGDYKLPVKAGVFNQLSFQGRWDGMTSHSSGKRDMTVWNEGIHQLTTTDPARNRVTVGATLSHVYKAVHADVRLNYEKYFYHHDVTPAAGNGDKVVAELVIRF